MNQDYYLNQKLSDLKSQLRIKEYERGKIWGGAWWLSIIIIPLFAILVIVKFSKARSLDKDIENLHNQIRDIEREMRNKNS
ncbi:hypothetical protein [endosymbiont GvMRE of Glomus versiforme]|uniref:hypothetical protein n=1 Tax=endosymbiont GvMRE of Glomus versiforme TaxID=2039283 RepID=UPI000ED09DE8|nr:hypothetical protein [endosymbiont GvMRE of Glomus versiforme]RHZ36178.1 hypothetical protein GvMRE_Ic2g78 [endosymbiont GvMRE of Glomus versiforme]